MVHQRKRLLFFPGIPNHWSNGSTHQSIIEDKQSTEARPASLRTLPPQQHKPTMAMMMALAPGIGRSLLTGFSKQVMILATVDPNAKRCNAKADSFS